MFNKHKFKHWYYIGNMTILTHFKTTETKARAEWVVVVKHPHIYIQWLVKYIQLANTLCLVMKIRNSEYFNPIIIISQYQFVHNSSTWTNKYKYISLLQKTTINKLNTLHTNVYISHILTITRLHYNNATNGIAFNLKEM